MVKQNGYWKKYLILLKPATKIITTTVITRTTEY